MPKATTKIRVFVASPGDVQAERKALQGVVEEINRIHGDEWGCTVELVRWETHARPAAGRPQGVINEQIGAYDVFVGIMWARFGTPTGKAGSGTEEEFNLAHAAWKRKRKHKPHVMFYFSDAKVRPSAVDPDQLAKVRAFRARVQKDHLVWSYSGSRRFADTIRQHLTATVREIATQTAAPATKRTPKPSATPARPKRQKTMPAASKPTSTASTPASQSRKRNTPRPKATSSIPLPDVRKPITDLERKTFLKKAYSTILAYFRRAGRETHQRFDHLTVEVDTLGTTGFTCTLYDAGRQVNQCKVWLGRGGFGSSESISYAEGQHLDLHAHSSVNEWATAEEENGQLVLRVSGLWQWAGVQGERVRTPAQTAEYLWRRFTQALR